MERERDYKICNFEVKAYLVHIFWMHWEGGYIKALLFYILEFQAGSIWCMLAYMEAYMLRPLHTYTTCAIQFWKSSNIFHAYLVWSTLTETDGHSFDIVAHRPSSHVPWKRLKHSLSLRFLSFLDGRHHVLDLHCASRGELFCVNGSRSLRRDYRCGSGLSTCKTWNAAISFSFSTFMRLIVLHVRSTWGRHFDFWNHRQ